MEIMQDAGSIPAASIRRMNVFYFKGETVMWNWLTNAGSYIKFLCWVGWHMWEHVYNNDGTTNHKKCKHCGTTVE